jgi:hypothetical protein
MMGGGGFLRLKGCQTWPESNKQAKVGVAILPKILKIVPFLGLNLSQDQEKTRDSCILANFC